jgi:hypothetical protein
MLAALPSDLLADSPPHRIAGSERPTATSTVTAPERRITHTMVRL